MVEGPGADSEEKHEPVSDIDTAEADSQKVLTSNGGLEKQTSGKRAQNDAYDTSQTSVLR